MPAAFQPGDSVIYRPGGSLGIVVAPPADGFVQIVLDNRRQTVRVEELDLQEGPIFEVADQIRASAPVDASGIRLMLTLLRLSRPLSDTLYSYRASRTKFSPHQFKPLLKILDAPSPRLLIADEVGVGKTIEAAIILMELQARQFFLPNEVNLILCPAALAGKWQHELGTKFGLEASILSAAGVRGWVHKLETYGRLSYGELLCIGSLQGLRSEESQNALDRCFDLGLRIGLLVVDEAHHARNTGTLSYQLVGTLAEAARAVAFLSATPLNLGDRDFYNLLHLLDPVLFGDPAAFASMLEPVRLLNRAIRILESGADDRRGAAWNELVDLDSVDTGRLVLDDPRWLLVQDLLLDAAGWNEQRAVQARNLLSEVSPLAHSFTRTRKRDVVVPPPIREAIPVTVTFTPAQAEFYDHATRLILDEWVEAHAGMAPAFIHIMLQRRMSSCLPAFIDSLEATVAAGSLTDFEPESEELDPAADLADDGVWTLDVSPQIDTIAALVGMGQAIRGEPDPKLNALLHVLESVVREESRRCIVFSFFVGTIQYLERELGSRGFRVGAMHGGVDPEKDLPGRPSRRTVTDRFWRGDIDILLSSEVGGEGLDFQCANVVVNYDLPWNPMRVEQRIGRVDRYGQTAERILVYNLLVKGTIEERILHRLYTRLGIFHEAVGPLEPVLGEEAVSWEALVIRVHLSPDEIDVVEKRLEAGRCTYQQNMHRFENLRDELAMDDVFTEKVIRAQHDGDLIEPADLHELYRTALERSFPQSRMISDGDAKVRLKPGGDLLGAINSKLARQTLQKADPREAQGWLRAFAPLIDKPEILATFDASLAAPGDDTQVFSAVHPLSRLLAESLTDPARTAGARVGLAGIAVSFALGLFVLEVRGYRCSVRLVPAAVESGTGSWTALRGSEAQALLRRTAAEGIACPRLPAREAVVDAAAALERAILPLRIEMEEESRRTANATVDQRLRSHDAMVTRQQRRQREMIDRMQREGKQRGARLNEGNLASFLNRQQAVRAEIERARQVSVLHSLAGLIWIEPVG